MFYRKWIIRLMVYLMIISMLGSVIFYTIEAMTW